jgi:transposase
MQIVFPSQLQYWLYTGATDMRKSFDGLSGMVQQQMALSSLCRAVFIFLNRRRNRIKLLHWQGDGFAIYYKRLERGTYEIPQTSSNTVTLSSRQLQYILDGVWLSSVKNRRRYQHGG